MQNADEPGPLEKVQAVMHSFFLFICTLMIVALVFCSTFARSCCSTPANTTNNSKGELLSISISRFRATANSELVRVFRLVPQFVQATWELLTTLNDSAQYDQASLWFIPLRDLHMLLLPELNCGECTLNRSLVLLAQLVTAAIKFLTSIVSKASLFLLTTREFCSLASE